MDSLENLISKSLQQGVIKRSAHLRIVRSTPESSAVEPVRSTIAITPGVCERCRGAGYLRANVPFGHPQWGKPQPCECKIMAQKRELQEQLKVNSGIFSFGLFEEATFDTFEQTLPGVYGAVRAAIEFADDPMGWLILVGPYGCGKTHLAVSIAKRLIDARRLVMMQTAPDLLDHLRSAFDPGSGQNYSETFEQMRNVDVLILDDYGAQSNTAWATEKLFQLLNHRYNHKLATVITSNDLKSGDQRLYSRMCDRRLVRKIEMDASDYRIYGDTVVEG